MYRLGAYDRAKESVEGGYNVTVPAFAGFLLKETQKKQSGMQKKLSSVILKGLDKVNQIKSEQKAVLKEVEVANEYARTEAYLSKNLLT